jgi:predicted RNA-binding protein Jag
MEEKQLPILVAELTVKLDALTRLCEEGFRREAGRIDRLEIDVAVLREWRAAQLAEQAADRQNERNESSGTPLWVKVMTAFLGVLTLALTVLQGMSH